MSSMESTPRKAHIAIVASPGMGHLIPSLELAKTLVSHHDLKVTLFVPTTSSSESSTSPQSQLLTSSLSSLPPISQDLITLINLPAVDISKVVPPESQLATRISAAVRESLPSVKTIIEESQQVPTVLITDMFGTDAFDIIGDAFQMRKYLFSPTNLTATAFFAYMPKLDPKHFNEPLFRVPGCKPVRVGVLDPTFSDPKCGDHGCMLQHARRFVQVSGVLVNTFEDLEPETVRALSDDEMARQIPLPHVYPIGPIIKSAVAASPKEPIHHSLSWLDKQTPDSVLFVSFGSGGMLSAEQVIELAWGLERSEERFIWVVRKPNDIKAVSSTYLGATGGGLDDPSEFLPDGFLSRTQGVGLVVPNWAPQVEILSHESIGGFLSHCGWNSSLESIVNGVPIIPWPLFAEQRLNASMLSDHISVAVRSPIQFEKRVLVGREEIEKMVRMVMEGEEGVLLRRRAKELKHRAMEALTKGGSSYNSLSNLAEKWNSNANESGIILGE